MTEPPARRPLPLQLLIKMRLQMLRLFRKIILKAAVDATVLKEQGPIKVR